MNFTISAEDQAKIDKWLMEVVYPPIIESQRQEGRRVGDYPYEGAIGGGLTYEFTPTSLGVVVKVRYNDQSLDLTNYDEW